MTPPHSPIIIRATMLRYLDVCERRIWLDYHADPMLRDDATFSHTQRLHDGVLHEAKIQSATSQHTEIHNVDGWSEAVQTTTDLIQSGRGGIVNACFQSQIELKGIPNPIILVGKTDRLIRQDNTYHPHQKPVYIPVEIKSYQTLTDADRLQLDMYCWLLGQVQGIEPTHGEFWLGMSPQSQPSEKRGHIYDEYRLMRAIREIARMILSQDELAPYIATHCQTCHWYKLCQKKAQANFDISLLVGLRKETHADMKGAGIHTLDQLVQLQPQDLKRFRGINTTAHVFHAQARAWVEQMPIWLNPIPNLLRAGGWMFDLETYQDIQTREEIVWSIGWCDENSNSYAAVIVPHIQPRSIFVNDSLTIHLVPNTDSAWRLMMQAMPDDKPIYHWTGYDSGMMKKSAPMDVQNTLAPRLSDLHAIFKKTVCFPITSLSIKTVATYLGFRWAGYDDYLQAYFDYRHWLKTGDNRHLLQSVNYQVDDVKALAIVWRYLVQHIP